MDEVIHTGVRIKPGSMMETVNPHGAISRRKASLNASNACLEPLHQISRKMYSEPYHHPIWKHDNRPESVLPAYALMPFMARKPATLVTLITRPCLPLYTFHFQSH
jgi:hypothetical protein